MVTSSSASSASMAARASCEELFAFAGRHRRRTALRPGRGTAPAADRAARRRSARRAAAWRSSRSSSTKRSGVVRRWRSSARVARSANRRCTSSSADSSPSLPSIAPPRPARIAGSGSHWPSSRSEPRPKPGAQERRFAGARGAENDEQARRPACREAAQRIDAARDIGAASEEDGGILRLERFEPAIGRAPAERPVRVRLQLEGLGADADLLEAALAGS